MHLVIQIPCLNEEAHVGAVIKDIRREDFGPLKVTILVIDDGSTDETVKEAFAAGADLVASHAENQGLAKAYITGLCAAVNAGADMIVNIDADNQYKASSISALIQPLVEGQADIAVGTRPIRDMQHFSETKKTLQYFGSWVVRQVSQTPVADATSGFRAITRHAAIRLSMFTNYTYTLETLIQAGRSGLKVTSVDIETNGPTRPSRLMKSMWRYVLRSARDILLMFTIYAPMRSYSIASSLPLALSFLLGMRYAALVLFVDPSRSHTPSLILAAVLAILGFVLFALGVIGEMISVNRRILEQLQFQQRLGAAERGELRGHCKYELITAGAAA